AGGGVEVGGQGRCAGGGARGGAGRGRGGRGGGWRGGGKRRGGGGRGWVRTPRAPSRRAHPTKAACRRRPAPRPRIPGATARWERNAWKPFQVPSATPTGRRPIAATRRRAGQVASAQARSRASPRGAPSPPPTRTPA